jgi:DNA-binding CsgD family transcriptional regulator
MTDLVGREAELAMIDRFLEEASREFRVLRIEGEPGIGKSALVDAVVERAALRGTRVLRASPAGSETQMAFAALTDILRPIAADDLAWMPEPQRVALEVVLLVRSHKGRVLPRAVQAGTLALLERATAERPLLVTIDDEQWLDAASASAVGFAMRRLADWPVGFVVARRTDGGGDREGPDLAPLRPDDALRLVPSRLTLSATYHLVRERLGLEPPRPLLRRIHQVSGGNPLFALEIARAVGADDRTGGVFATGPLTVPETLVSLVARRLGHRTEDERVAMAIVAAAGEATHGLVRSVDAPAAEALAGLVEAGILVRHSGLLRFVHPVLAEVSLGLVDTSRRRTIHGLLATRVEQMEARARHRALAADGPDAAASEELAQAARVVARTSAEGACELLELAIAATPESDEAALDERRLTLARLRHRSGDSPGASTLVDELLPRATGPFRATALEFGANLDWVVGSADRAEARCEEALRQDGVDDHLRSRILVTLARVTLEPGLSLNHGQSALALIEAASIDDPEVECGAIAAIAGARAALGEGIPPGLVERGLALEARSPALDVGDRLSASLGVWLKYEGRLEEARTWLRATRDAAVAEGDESSLPYALSHLPQLELWTGDWEAAEADAREHLAVSEWTGQHEQRLTAVFSLSLVDAHRGRSNEARRRIADALPVAERVDPWNVYQLLSVLGFVELSEGRLGEAIVALRRAHDIYEAAGAGDTPAVFENLSEALVANGDLDEATDVISVYLERARRLGRPMNIAPASRSLALLHAARGDHDAARAAITEAIGHHADPLVPFSRARSLLVAGQIHRRLGERRAARDAIEEARATFARLGSPPWLMRADGEMARIPIRRAAASDALTPTEERIAALVRRGLTNREVAAEVFVTTKTVEANLTRIYAKLGVRSRAELAARRPLEAAEGPNL